MIVEEREEKEKEEKEEAPKTEKETRESPKPRSKAQDQILQTSAKLSRWISSG